mgnify:FL=1
MIDQKRAGIYRIGDGRHLILMLLKHHRITVDDTVFRKGELKNDSFAGLWQRTDN